MMEYRVTRRVEKGKGLKIGKKGLKEGREGVEERT